MKILNIFSLISLFITFVNCIEIPASSLIVKDALAVINRSNVNNISVFLEDSSIKAKRDELDDIYNACQSEQNSFSECYTNGKNDTETCNIMNGERCEKFYKNPEAYIPSCEKFDKTLAQGVYAFYKYLGSLWHLVCAENGNCEVAKELSNKIKAGKIEPSDLISPSESAINNDCQNKDCVGVVIDMYEKQREFITVNIKVSNEKGKLGSPVEVRNENVIKGMIDKILEQLRAPTCVQLNGIVKLNTSTILLFSIITFTLLFLI